MEWEITDFDFWMVPMFLSLSIWKLLFWKLVVLLYYFAYNFTSSLTGLGWHHLSSNAHKPCNLRVALVFLSSTVDCLTAGQASAVYFTSSLVRIPRKELISPDSKSGKQTWVSTTAVGVSHNHHLPLLPGAVTHFRRVPLCFPRQSFLLCLWYQGTELFCR